MNKLIIKLIRFYQNKLHKNNTSYCKYKPSCSNYGIEAYSKFSFFIATILTIYRIIRCNPFSHGGYDPIPTNRYEKDLEKITNLFNRPS